MKLNNFSYDLPDELIAQEPLDDRAASRLLVVDPSARTLAHRQFRDCLELLHPGDLLVMNNTRVTAKRLLGTKTTGGAVEALLLHEIEPGLFEALLKPGRRLPVGARIIFSPTLEALVESEAGDGIKTIRFEETPGWRGAIEEIGLTPLPPYIHHHLLDQERYQTVYASAPGSAAAPTAGLHFTPELLAAIRAKGVGITEVTLGVSIDTFRPIAVSDLATHVMHGEVCSVSPEAAEAINRAKGRIIAVGTTTVRTLESFAVGDRKVEAGTQVSRLFIRPGFAFKVINGMFTNFHLPETTMLLMICAMADQELIRRAYVEAVRSRYRFLSFGDSMLIL